MLSAVPLVLRGLSGALMLLSAVLGARAWWLGRVADRCSQVSQLVTAVIAEREAGNFAGAWQLLGAADDVAPPVMRPHVTAERDRLATSWASALRANDDPRELARATALLAPVLWRAAAHAAGPRRAELLAEIGRVERLGGSRER